MKTTIEVGKLYRPGASREKRRVRRVYTDDRGHEIVSYEVVEGKGHRVGKLYNDTMENFATCRKCRQQSMR